jgi:hypothetical protein
MFLPDDCKQFIPANLVSVPLLCVKNIHLEDRTDLFKISNLVLGGKAIITSVYSSLEKQTDRQRDKQDACRSSHQLRHGKQRYLGDKEKVKPSHYRPGEAQ